MHVDLDVYRPIGRLFGNLYASQRDTFALTRESHDAWCKRMDSGGRDAKYPADCIEIAEQAPDRAVDVEIDVHPGLVDQTIPRVQAQHLSDQQFAPRSDASAPAPALQCKGSGRQRARRRRSTAMWPALLPPLRCSRRNPPRSRSWRPRAPHPHVHDELSAAMDVARVSLD